MKKTFLSLAVAMLPLLSFGYYGDYDKPEMSGWAIFLIIVLFVVGILQIILFFKVWGMTNNVSELNRKINKDLDSYQVVEATYYTKKELLGQEEANLYLKNMLVEEYKTISMTKSAIEYQTKEMMAKYGKLLDDSGVMLPEFKGIVEESIKTYSGFVPGAKVIVKGTLVICSFVGVSDKGRAIISNNGSCFEYDFADLQLA